MGCVTALIITAWVPSALRARRDAAPAGRVALCGVFGTCRDTGCHALPESMTLTWELRQAVPDAPLPAYWSPGAPLDLVLRASDPAAWFMGFQIAAILPCAPPQPENGGLLEILEPGRTTLVTDDFEIAYVTHSCTCGDVYDCCGFVPEVPASGNFEWTFRWTPPPRGSGPVTFHLAINSADGDGSPNGDQIGVGEVFLEEEPCPPTIDDLRVRVAACDPAAPGEPRIELWRTSGDPMDFIREAGDTLEASLPAAGWSLAVNGCRPLFDGRNLVTWSIAPTCDLGGEGLH